MRNLLIFGAGAIGIIILFLASGFLLPRAHMARASAVIAAPRDKVWKLIADMKNTPSWLADAQAVERLPPEDGREVWKQTGRSGGTLIFATLRSEPVHLLVRQARDPGGAFGGIWTFHLTDEGAATKVEIVEEGWIAVAPFRPIQRFLIGFDTTMKSYLAHLSRAAEGK